MLNEYECERIRRSHYLEKKSIYRVDKEDGYGHQAIEKSLFDPLPKPYQLSHLKPAPIIGPYRPRVETLLCQSNEEASHPAQVKVEYLDRSSRPDLAIIGNQSVDLSGYEQLLKLW